MLCEQKTLLLEQNVKRGCCHDTRIGIKEVVKKEVVKKEAVKKEAVKKEGGW